jgi:proline iminopeptidase
MGFAHPAHHLARCPDVSASASPRDRFVAFRRSAPRTPTLTAHRVRARGLEFAVFTSPEVSGAPPLACVNGGMLYDHKLLWPALSPLAEHRQLIFYDQRGRGASQEPPGPRVARIEHDAGDLPALREALGFRQWDVLGHSWGGGIATLGAERDREGVRRLVLVNSVGPTGWWLPTLHESALGRLPPSERAVLTRLEPSALSAPDPAIHSAYSRAIYPAWFADPELAKLFAPPRSESRTGAAIVARLRKEGYDWTNFVRAVRAGVIVIHGARDLLPPAVARELVALIPNSRLALIQNAGHMPFWETPDEFFMLVNSFLRGA